MSTATITKRADELKPGDVLPADEAWMRRIILSVEPSAHHSGLLAVRWGGLGSGAVDTMSFVPSKVFKVESPALSPAQQHAEEMLDLLRRAVDRLASDLHIPIKDLLAKIDPPAPPTLEEALESLNRLRSNLNMPGSPERISELQAADSLLDRARRAGSLK